MAVERKNRRDALRGIVRVGAGLTTIGLGLWAFAPDSSRVGDQSAPAVATPVAEPNPDFSVNVIIPAQDNLVTVTNAAENLKPAIGLRQLFLGSMQDVPAIVVFAIWDKATNTDVKHSVSPIGFQQIQEPFVPNTDLYPEINVDVAEFEKALEQTRLFASRVNRETNRKIFTEPSTVALIARPVINTRHALVFGAGATTYKGAPSQNSYLNMSFNFDHFRNPKAI